MCGRARLILVRGEWGGVRRHNEALTFDNRLWQRIRGQGQGVGERERGTRELSNTCVEMLCGLAYLSHRIIAGEIAWIDARIIGRLQAAGLLVAVTEDAGAIGARYEVT